MAKRKKTNEVTAGFFVIAVLAVTLGVVLWLGASDLLATRGQTVNFFVPESKGDVGLRAGSGVFYGGTKIGEITEIQTLLGEGSLYRARLNREDIRVYSDAAAVVSAPFIGEYKLVIRDFGGAEGASDPDGDNPVALQAGGIEAIMNAAAGEFDRNRPGSMLAKIHSIVDDLSRIAKNVETELGTSRPETLLSEIHAVVAELKQAAAHVREQLNVEHDGSLIAKLSSALDDVGKTAAALAKETDASEKASLIAKVRSGIDEINAMVAKASPKIDRTLTSVEKTAAAMQGYTEKDIAELLAKMRDIGTNVLKMSKDFSETSAAMKRLIAGNSDNIDEMIDNMVLVSADLKATAREVRRNPWRLLYRPEEEKLREANIYDAASAYASGAAELDQAVTKLRALRRMKEDDPRLEATIERIHTHLKDSFAKLKKVEEKLWKELEVKE